MFLKKMYFCIRNTHSRIRRNLVKTKAELAFPLCDRKIILNIETLLSVCTILSLIPPTLPSATGFFKGMKCQPFWQNKLTGKLHTPFSRCSFHFVWKYVLLYSVSKTHVEIGLEDAINVDCIHFNVGKGYS